MHFPHTGRSPDHTPADRSSAVHRHYSVRKRYSVHRRYSVRKNTLPGRSCSALRNSADRKAGSHSPGRSHFLPDRSSDRKAGLHSPVHKADLRFPVHNRFPAGRKHSLPAGRPAASFRYSLPRPADRMHPVLPADRTHPAFPADSLPPQIPAVSVPGRSQNCNFCSHSDPSFVSLFSKFLSKNNTHYHFSITERLLLLKQICANSTFILSV